MAVTATNLTMGPGTLYRGEFGAAEPTDTEVAAPPGVDWADVGGTFDGVTLSVTQEYTELEVDQIVDVPGRRLTKREFMLETNLAEPTLANLEFVLNGGEVTDTAAGASAPGISAYDPSEGTSATQPTYSALIFDGFAPNSFPRRVILRKCLSVESTEFAYKKDEQTVFSAQFAAHYVSGAIKPFRIVDQTAVPTS